METAQWSPTSDGDPSGHKIQVRLMITIAWDHSPSPRLGLKLHSLKSIKIMLEKAVRRVTQTNTKISSAIHIKEF